MPDADLETPIGTFREYVERLAPTEITNPAPPVDDRVWGPKVKFQLLEDGKPIGYLGMNNDEWCVVTPQVEYALVLHLNAKSRLEGLYYFKVANRTDSWLSCSFLSAYIGVYGWSQAAVWRMYEFEGAASVSLGEEWGNPLCVFNEPQNIFVFASNDKKYRHLRVRFIPA